MKETLGDVALETVKNGLSLLEKEPVSLWQVTNGRDGLAELPGTPKSTGQSFENRPSQSIFLEKGLWPQICG